ncbi:glycosyltransferase family 39 protein [Acidiferrimicrobium sp. IK]|uniref:ArnT family glycosyltransferase n=1 Tax=Acidiferrimicrobium sp. IK TaxID=2871700 RepID=UPI0021CB4214|nr:glycosyltransferase family 39 protein [Acidiferrimicrobium sp. IK]MCU4186284.1 glycosyltransferase family 39 protein [Acidiferrimicrobium sp. IK]
MTATATDLEALGLRRPEPGDVGPDDVLTLRRRLWVWGGLHRASLLIVGGLLAVAGAVHGWGAAHSPALTDDEGTYMAQAWAVQVQHTLAPYTYWYDHPPLAWLQIAGWTWLTGSFRPSVDAIDAGRQLMVIASMISSGLLYVLSRRLEMRRWTAAVVVALFALSPLAVDYQRLVLLDNVAVPWLLAAMVLAASPRRSLWAASAAGACMAVSILSKETFLLFLPAVAVLLWVRADRRTRSFCLTGFAATFVLLAAAYPLYATLKGELIPGKGHVSLWQAVDFQLFARQSSGSLFAAGSNAHTTAANWLHLDAWLLGVGLLALPVSLSARRAWPVIVALAVPLLTILRGGYLPDPFVIGLLPFAALSVGMALDVLAGPRPAGPDRTGPQRPASLVERMARTAGAARRPSGRGALAAGVAVALVLTVAPRWDHGDRALAAANATTPVWSAETWIEQHVSKNQRLIVDDSIWVDLVEHGFDPDLGVVWFYKLDNSNNLDPSVSRALPQGWKDFGYIVSTPVIRSALAQMPGQLTPVRDAIGSSQVVASFGAGAATVQVRRITVPGRTWPTTVRRPAPAPARP